MSYPWPNPEGLQEVEDAFLQHMTSAVRFVRRTSSNEYGEESYAAEPLEVPGFLDGGSAEDFTARSTNTVHVTGVALLGHVVPWLTPDDQMWVEDENVAGGWRRTVIGGVERVYGPNGIHHQEIYYGPLGRAGQGVGDG